LVLEIDQFLLYQNLSVFIVAQKPYVDSCYCSITNETTVLVVNHLWYEQNWN